VLRSALTAVALSALLLPAATSARASAPAQEGSGQGPALEAGTANPDPWESTNRGLFKINKGLDRAVIRPTATFYRHAVAHPIREGVGNVLSNLGEPVTFVNRLLQVRPTKAVNSAARFGVNSTIGILGIFDVATGAGLPADPSGFAQTLGRYGTPEGPFVFIPVLGPSSVRDLTGRIVDGFADPINIVPYKGRSVVQPVAAVAGGLEARVALDATLKDVNRTATDPYATERSAFLQNSRLQANDGAEDVKTLPDFGAEPAPAKPRP